MMDGKYSNQMLIRILENKWYHLLGLYGQENWVISQYVTILMILLRMWYYFLDVGLIAFLFIIWKE